MIFSPARLVFLVFFTLSLCAQEEPVNFIQERCGQSAGILTRLYPSKGLFSGDVSYESFSEPRILASKEAKGTMPLERNLFAQIKYSAYMSTHIIPFLLKRHSTQSVTFNLLSKELSEGLPQGNKKIESTDKLNTAIQELESIIKKDSEARGDIKRYLHQDDNIYVEEKKQESVIRPTKLGWAALAAAAVGLGGWWYIRTK